MSKDYRREKNSWDDSDWVVGADSAARKDSKNQDIEKRKRDSKRLSRERDRHHQPH